MAFKIKTNDTSPKLTVDLADAAGSAIDLSGATAKFKMKRYGASTLKVDEVADITDEANGRVEYSWSSVDTDTAGTYYGEIEVTYADTSVETFPNTGYFTVIIREDLD
jgi:Rib/alpha/Esp surface antigen-like repeat protein